jgi:DNA-binding PadR family transcriptional regulator
MATTQVVLGLLVRGAVNRSAIVRQYKKGSFDRSLMTLRRPRLRLHEHDELQVVAADAVGTPEARIDAALVSLKERGLVEASAVCRDSRTSRVQDTVYAVTSAGRAHFEWWLGDASTLDPAGDELWQKLLFCEKQHASRMIELIRCQELLSLERLEALRCSIERMTFARCSTFEQFWDAALADEEPSRMQCTIATVQKARSVLGGMLDNAGEETGETWRAVE